MASLALHSPPMTRMDLAYSTQIDDDAAHFSSQEALASHFATGSAARHGPTSERPLDTSQLRQQRDALFSLVNGDTTGSAKDASRSHALDQSQTAASTSRRMFEAPVAVRVASSVPAVPEKPKPRKRPRLHGPDNSLASRHDYLFPAKSGERGNFGAARAIDESLVSTKVQHIKYLCEQSRLKEAAQEIEACNTALTRAVLEQLESPHIIDINAAMRRISHGLRLNATPASSHSQPSSQAARPTAIVYPVNTDDEDSAEDDTPSSPPSVSKSTSSEARDGNDHALVAPDGEVSNSPRLPDRSRSATPLPEWSQTPSKANSMRPAVRDAFTDERPPDSSHEPQGAVWARDASHESQKQHLARDDEQDLPKLLDDQLPNQLDDLTGPKLPSDSSDDLDVAEPIALADPYDQPYLEQPSYAAEAFLLSQTSPCASQTSQVLETPYVAMKRRLSDHSSRHSHGSPEILVPGTLNKPKGQQSGQLPDWGTVSQWDEQQYPTALDGTTTADQEPQEMDIDEDVVQLDMQPVSATAPAVVEENQHNRIRTPETKPDLFTFETPTSKSPGAFVHAQRRRWFEDHAAAEDGVHKREDVVEAACSPDHAVEAGIAGAVIGSPQQSSHSRSAAGTSSSASSSSIQGVFDKFKAAYPSYQATLKDFTQVCAMISRSDMHKSLWDDFVVVITGSLQENIAAANSNPVDYYNATVDEPTHHKRILNPQALQQLLLAATDDPETQASPRNKALKMTDSAMITVAAPPDSRAMSMPKPQSTTNTPNDLDSPALPSRRVLPWVKRSSQAQAAHQPSSTTTSTPQTMRPRPSQTQLTPSLPQQQHQQTQTISISSDEEDAHFIASRRSRAPESSSDFRATLDTAHATPHPPRPVPRTQRNSGVDQSVDLSLQGGLLPTSSTTKQSTSQVSQSRRSAAPSTALPPGETENATAAKSSDGTVEGPYFRFARNYLGLKIHDGVLSELGSEPGTVARAQSRPKVDILAWKF